MPATQPKTFQVTSYSRTYGHRVYSTCAMTYGRARQIAAVNSRNSADFVYVVESRRGDRRMDAMTVAAA